MNSASLPTVKLKPGKDQSLIRRHPWVFSGAIYSISQELSPGQTVQVYSSNERYLGTGHWSDGSISVRIFSFEPFEDTQAFWNEKIAKAFELRKKMGLIDQPHTTIYRLVHGEGDGLPGLIIDVYGKTAVFQAHSTGMHLLKATITAALHQVLGEKITAVYDKSGEKLLQQSGEQIQNAYLSGAQGDQVCLEYGHQFKIDWEQGQKTGFFIDQRENRKLLGSMSKGKKVLNTFCYTGGFSIYALAEGASLVHSLDSSQKAIDLTDENVRINGFEGARHASIKADAVEYLSDLKEDYDIIVLDPPAFAKHLSARHKAVQGYMRINEAAFKRIQPGGILFTFSCSQAVDKKLFHDSIMAAAIKAGRDVRILHQLHQPADHPISMFHPEGEYLKGLVLEVL